MVEENKKGDAEKSEYKDFKSVQDKCGKIIDEYVSKEFELKGYNPHDAQKQSNDASEEIIKMIQTELGDEIELKFTATIIILQKADSGFHMSASCFWDSKADGNINKKFEFKDFYVICNFFCISRAWGPPIFFID